MAHEARNLGITINVPLARTCDFAHRPENFIKWAGGDGEDAAP